MMVVRDSINGWVEESGMLGGPLSPLLFNIYVRLREFGMNIAHCKHGFKYLMMDRDGVIVERRQTGFLYADDVCLITSNEKGHTKYF